MIPTIVRKYLISALSGTPDVVERLLKDLGADDLRWNFRPDPERFNLREVVAHLADWEPIHLERLVRMQEEDNPALPDIDEGALAVENDYAHSEPHGSLEWLRGGRQKFVQRLEALNDAEWIRPGVRDTIGAITIQILAVFVLAHDGYHTRQIAQWLALAEARQ